jgi:hypothetical protein
MPVPVDAFVAEWGNRRVGGNRGGIGGTETIMRVVKRTGHMTGYNRATNLQAGVLGVGKKSVEFLAPNLIVNTAKSSTDLPTTPGYDFMLRVFTIFRRMIFWAYFSGRMILRV